MSESSRDPVLSARPLYDRESGGTTSLAAQRALRSRVHNSATASPTGFDTVPVHRKALDKHDGVDRNRGLQAPASQPDSPRPWQRTRLDRAMALKRSVTAH